MRLESWFGIASVHAHVSMFGVQVRCTCVLIARNVLCVDVLFVGFATKDIYIGAATLWLC